MPSPPSTRMRWPSLMRRVAVPVPTTAGRPYSRATMAAWLIEPPMSDTAAEILRKIGDQVGLVTWHTRMSPSSKREISSTDFTTRAVPSTTPRDAANPLSTFESAFSPAVSQASRLSRVMPHSITMAGSSMISGTGPSAGGVSFFAHRAMAARRVGDDRRPVLRSARRRAGRPGLHQVDDRGLQLIVREVEHVVFAREESVLGQQRPEFADLVEEQVGVPVLAVELVAFHVREHAMRQRDHLVERRALLVGVEQVAVVGNQLRALGDQLRHRAVEIGPGLQLADVAGQGRERHRQVVVPRAMVVIEAVSDVHVEPGVTRGLQFLQPLPALRSQLAQRLQHLLHADAILERRVHAQLHGAARQARSSSSGRKISASMPATMRAMVWSLISGKAFLQNPKKVRYAP